MSRHQPADMDEAIDRAVRRMVAVAPRPGLDGRVRARLAAAAPARRVTGLRLAPAVVALAIVVLILNTLPRERREDAGAAAVHRSDASAAPPQSWTVVPRQSQEAVPEAEVAASSEPPAAGVAAARHAAPPPHDRPVEAAANPRDDTAPLPIPSPAGAPSTGRAFAATPRIAAGTAVEAEPGAAAEVPIADAAPGRLTITPLSVTPLQITPIEIAPIDVDRHP